MSRLRGDDVLVRQSARGIGVRVAALVAAAMLALMGAVTLLVVHEQGVAADDSLRRAAAQVDDVGDPPPASWILISSRGRVTTSPGMPSTLTRALRELRDTAPTQPRLSTLSGDEGQSYRVITRHEAAQDIQVVMDRAPALAERRRLIVGMGYASALALALAGGLGLLIGARAVRPLAEALSLQRAFIADASHELRTPLTLLSTRAQLLERELTQTAVAQRLVDDSRGVVDDVQRLGAVVEDLLVAADPRADVEHVAVDLGELVSAAVGSARAHASDAGIELNCDVGRSSGGALVLGSPVALRRAVLALLDNAIDHTPAEGQVMVRVRREHRNLVIQVSDTGPGIAPSELSRVTRRFHSGGQRAARSHYGLGLALTHDVANRHGGQLRLGHGSPGATFELVLPAVSES